MTRSELEDTVAEARRYGGTWLEAPLAAVLRHDAEQREEIERLRGELSHWTFVRFKELEAENERLRMALQGIIDIGKRDMTNPKYDGYFEAAYHALTQEPR